MSAILSVSPDEICLDSGMNESAFGKTNMSLQLSEDSGTLVEFDEAGSPVHYKPWHFSKIKTDRENGQVAFYGEGFTGIPLKTLFENGSEKDISPAVILISRAISKAVSGNHFIPAVGAGGIIAGKNSILFLPKLIFESSCASLSDKEKSEENGFYLFKGAEKKAALYFLQSVILYRTLCKNFPFTETDESTRQNDIIDAHFLPLEYAVNGIDKTLAKAVDEALAPSKKTETDLQTRVPLGTLQKELGIKTDGSYEVYSRIPSIPQEDFEKSSKSFFEKQQNTVSAKRFIYRNKISLICIFVAVIFIIYGISSYTKRLGRLPTTKGFTAEQTVQQFYAGIHTLDTEKMSESSKGSSAKQAVNGIGAMYVTVKARSGYEQNAQTYTPERWFNIIENADTKHIPWIAGLSQVVIQSGAHEMQADLHAKIVQRNENPAAVQENGSIPEDGSKKTFNVSYFRLFTHGEIASITVETDSDSVVCTFIKDRWLVTGIQPLSSQTEEIELSKLQEKFADALKKSGNDCIQAADLLRSEYPWIPSEAVLSDEKIRLREDLKNFSF